METPPWAGREHRLREEGKGAESYLSLSTRQFVIEESENEAYMVVSMHLVCADGA